MARLVKLLVFALLALLAWNMLRHRAYRQHVHRVISLLAISLIGCAVLALLFRWLY